VIIYTIKLNIARENETAVGMNVKILIELEVFLLLKDTFCHACSFLCDY